MSLIIRGKQIKTTMRCLFEMAIFNKSIVHRTSAGEDVGKRELYALLVGMKTKAATMENNMEFPHKIKNGTVF